MTYFSNSERWNLKTVDIGIPNTVRMDFVAVFSCTEQETIYKSLKIDGKNDEYNSTSI